MQLTIGGKKYTFVFTTAATLCDDLLEAVVGSMRDVAGNSRKQETIGLAGNLPKLTKAMFYGGLLQMHGDRGDGSIESRDDAEALLYKYMEENQGKREGTLFYVFNALNDQMSDDNFLSRVGIVEETEKKPSAEEMEEPSAEEMEENPSVEN